MFLLHPLDSGLGRLSSAIRNLSSAIWLLPLAWLWFVLINDLRVEWTVNPQYSYGWAVPFLCAFLIWQRVQKANSGNAPHPGPPHEPPGSAGVPPASRIPKTGTRRRDASAPGNGAPVQGFNARIFVSGNSLPGAERELPSSILYLLFAVCALLYSPTRLIEVSNPGWRLMSWALAIEVVGLTLIFIRLALGASRPKSEVRSRKSEAGNQTSVLGPPLSAYQRFGVSDFVFPVCFFLVAVPWPSVIEWLVIQGLTRVDTACTTELLAWFGIPAMPHGNVIEVATGVVGIDEACSGIRSFQATLMISLFLGELYSLGTLRRVFCVFAGFALSFLFNLARMSLLVWVAARKGVAAIASWHDPSGVTILVACFLCLWGLGVGLQGKRKRAKGKIEERNVEGGNLKSEGGRGRAEDGAESRKQKTENKNRFQLSAFQISTFALAVWIPLTEFSVEAWYRSHEVNVPFAPQWTVAWPTNDASFKELVLPARTLQILRYDEGRSAAWEAGRLNWQAVFLRWKPGRTAIHLAQNHTPEICMTGAGHTLNSISPLEWFEVNGLRMPFLAYQVTDTPQPFFVFYCLWDDRASAQGFETMGLTYGNRLAPVLAGLRNPGQRSLEIAVAGPDNTADAVAAVRAELEKLIISKP